MTMKAEVLNAFKRINVHRDENGPALHKPLLLLLMLARYLRGEPRLASFAEIDDALGELLRSFHPAGSEHLNTHYPFGKLVNDGIWDVVSQTELKRTSAGHLLRTQLLHEGIQGGLVSEIYNQLAKDRSLILAACNEVAAAFLSEQTQERVFTHLSLPLPCATGQRASESALYQPETEARGDLLALNIADDGQPMIANDAFIAYLNSLHSLQASGANALAESQAVNPFFGDLYEPFALAAPLKELLRDQADHVVILSGHAGDGKSTVALDVYKALRGLDSLEPLTTPLREREPIALGTRAVTIVKDMSELSAEQRQDWLREAFTAGSGSWLIVSNTGPLLNSLREYGKDRGRPEAENDILALLDQPLNAERLEEHALAGFGKPLIILNLSRLDNTELGARLLGRLINHPGWQGCDGCPAQTYCPIGLNRRAVCDAGELAAQRLRWLYRRISAYEQRLTLRQIVAQLAFSLTGGMSCAQAKAAVELGSAGGVAPATDALAEIVFSEGFFGYRAGRPWPDGQGLRAVELAHRSHFGGPVSPELDRLMQSSPGDAWFELPACFHDLAETWRKARKSPSKRAALRRLLLVFGRARPGREAETDRFIDTLLRSPGLRLLDESRQQRRLALSPVDAGKLRDACLDVLREAFSGFTASQFDPRDHELYLTLRRPDRAVIQPTQLVVGSLSFRDFNVDYDPVARLPVLAYRRGRNGPAVELPLSLPLLDYILRRADGELGTALDPIHQAQLDGFQARLLHLDDARSHQEGAITLLRADISGSVDVHRYILDKDTDGKPQRLVKQR
jgi:hypothetical protein